MPQNSLSQIVQKSRTELLADWVKQQVTSGSMRQDLIKEDEVRAQSTDFFDRFSTALGGGELENIRADAWAPVLAQLTELSRTRGRMGFSPSETANFVFSLKRPLQAKIAADIKDP